jgi:type IV secretory pathway component VirB8
MRNEKTLEQKFKEASKIVKQSSSEVLKEFEEFMDDVNDNFLKIVKK